MESLNLVGVTRRAFLLRSAASVGALAPLIPVFPATALRALQGRQPLTQENLSGYVQGVRAQGAPAISGLVREAQADLRMFLRKRFDLDPVQDAFVSQLTPGQLAELGTAFERGLAGRNELIFQLPQRGVPRGKCDMTVRRVERPQGRAGTLETWSVVVQP